MADELPRIELPEPVIIPPVAAVEYRDAYLLSLWLEPTQPDNPEAQRCTVTLRPMDKSSGVVYPASDRDQRLAVEDVRAEAVGKPLWAYGMALICTLCDLEVKQRKLTAALAAAEESDKPALQAQLDAVLAAFQVVPGS